MYCVYRILLYCMCALASPCLNVNKCASLLRILRRCVSVKRNFRPTKKKKRKANEKCFFLSIAVYRLLACMCIDKKEAQIKKGKFGFSVSYGRPCESVWISSPSDRRRQFCVCTLYIICRVLNYGLRAYTKDTTLHYIGTIYNKACVSLQHRVSVA